MGRTDVNSNMTTVGFLFTRVVCLGVVLSLRSGKGRRVVGLPPRQIYNKDYNKKAIITVPVFCCGPRTSTEVNWCQNNHTRNT